MSVSVTGVSAADGCVSGVVQQLLGERGMSTADLAEGIGLGVRAVDNRIALVAPWWLWEVLKVADFLDVPYQTLLDR